jgi:hypothetical protein
MVARNGDQPDFAQEESRKNRRVGGERGEALLPAVLCQWTELTLRDTALRYRSPADLMRYQIKCRKLETPAGSRQLAACRT